KIESVAAGGGSICLQDGIRLRVGPESAGADPGPACYGRGGPLTLTDLNLLLGRLDPERFGVPIDPAAARVAFDQLHARVGGSAEALLQGLVQMADERMAASIRQVTASEGFDAADYPLVAFGGAGGLHACGVAERLEMTRILFPADSGLLSARGLRAARREAFAERQILEPLERAGARLPEWSGALRAGAAKEIALEETGHRAEIELRLAGQEAALLLPLAPAEKLPAAFARVYQKRFGYRPKDRAIEVVSLRVNVWEKKPRPPRETFARRRRLAVNAPLDRAKLRADDWLNGPAIIQDAFSSLYVAKGWRATAGTRGSILLERIGSGSGKQAGSGAVGLELMQNRLESIVEEMGGMLQRTAISTNVKERLDFSCALLDAEGRLIVNAPHIPVHLGALGLCVRRVAARLPLGPGDAAVTNHPAFGGSHLPDVTVIAPIFDERGRRLGYVANRAHHAEIGGLLPGSMPPAARNLEEEGVVIPPMHLLRAGRPGFDAVEKLLRQARHPSRRVEENLADLRAQVAAARRGAELLRGLAAKESPARVRKIFAAIRDRSARALAERLRECGDFTREAEEFLDDGARLAVRLTHRAEWLTFDFSGTSPRHPGNLNATPAILRSVILYVLRLLIPEPLPLNEGLLNRVKIKLPRCFLNPAFPADPAKCPPVVGGNTDTSQRLTDTLLKALGLAACSQGTMNNFLFGDAARSYYETIGGGGGAGPGFAGADAVHTHMTNTAITDPEILELRYPVRLREFAIRPRSGGRGKWRGGNGVIREIEFLEPCEVSLLTQHRREAPYGMESGQPGKRGAQTLILKSGAAAKLPSQAHFAAKRGDVLRIETPGGGGWGKAD
ncbi:MAG TPA: hydantoinase B/oxoprolinase family protein, partial [Chthoniobacterales bacterium]